MSNIANQRTRRLDILKNIQEGKMTADEAEEALCNGQRKTYCRETRNGAVAVYGLNRNGRPTVMYKDQWVRLVEFINTGELSTFLDTVVTKDDSSEAK
jgi:hypothetical protein